MRREWKLAFLAAGLLAVPFAALAWQSLFAPNAQWITRTGCYFGLDFVNFWSAGRLVLEGRVSEGYDPAAYGAILSQWFGPLNFTNLSYPPSLLLLVAPLAALPYFAALAVWQVLGASAFHWACLGRAPRKDDGVLIAALAFSPVLVSNLVFGQIALFMAALFVGALRLMPARPLLAGVMIGFLTVKPQLGVLIPFFLLAVGAWRTIAAAAVTALGLFAVSALAFGFEPWHAYFTTTAKIQWSYLLAMDNFYAIHMTTPFAALWSIGVPIAAALKMQGVVSAVVAVVTVWVARSSASWSLKTLVLAAGTVLAVPYSLAHDLAVPLAALIWYVSEEKAAPKPWFLIIAAGLWMMPFPLAFLLQLRGIPLTQALLAAFYVALAGIALGGYKRRPAGQQPLAAGV